MLLTVDELVAGYGNSQVLKGVSLRVDRGEVVTLIGRNGMGKSTALKAIMGIIRPRAGRIGFNGSIISGLPEYKVARAGIGLVPEGRGIFPNLTVEENLTAAANNRHRRASPWTLPSVYSMFPRLEERRRNLGSDLSGGEQQMLAIGRALMLNPLLMILDEATEGLAPLIRKEIWSSLEALRRQGLALIVVDKNIGALMGLGDRHYVFEKGDVVWSGTTAKFHSEQNVVTKYLAV
jgi:branched-chain amino acid transport system ATP-binding protein